MLIEGLYTTETFDKNEEGISAQIKLNPNHEIFKGHFPGKPIMPGVCMIQIIKELTERSLGQDLFLSVASNVKFMAIINPETDPILLIDINLSEMDGLFKVKSTTIFGETVALKLNATFKSAEEDNTILVAYKGAVSALTAKYTKDNTERKELFKNGVLLLEFAVSQKPENIEIRCLRLSIQENSPKFLKYRSNIEEDKTFILNHYEKTKSKAVKEFVKSYILQSTGFNTEEKQRF